MNKRQAMLEEMKKGKVFNYSQMEGRQYKMAEGNIYYRDSEEKGWSLSVVDGPYLVNTYFEYLSEA